MTVSVSQGLMIVCPLFSVPGFLNDWPEVCVYACPRVYKPVYVHHCLLNDDFDLTLTLC